MFWKIRGICGSSDNPMTPDIIGQWSGHTYRRFDKWERDALLMMDGAFRQSYSKVVVWHQKRKQVKADPDQQRMARGRGNSRL